MSRYSLELDILSGRPNPLLEISSTDYSLLRSEINNLEPIESNSFFEGLGFKGFILQENDSTVYFIQLDKIKIETKTGVLFKKNTLKLLTKLFQLFETYDLNKMYSSLIRIAKREYNIM